MLAYNYGRVCTVPYFSAIGKNVYKIRIAITGTSKGKSGGARVITYVKIIAHTVILTEIYLKSSTIQLMP